MKDVARLKEAKKQVGIVIENSDGDAESLPDVAWSLQAEIDVRESSDE